MLIPSELPDMLHGMTSLSRRVNANSQHKVINVSSYYKLIKKGEC